MLGYEFNIDYKKKKEKKKADNKVANALSMRDEVEESAALNAITIPNPIWLEESRNAYDSDPVAKQQLVALQQDPSSSSTFSLKQGILFKKIEDVHP